MALRTKIIEVGQSLQAHSFKFVEGDSSITILIELFKYSVDNVVCLLLMFDLVLHTTM